MENKANYSVTENVELRTNYNLTRKIDNITNYSFAIVKKWNRKKYTKRRSKIKEPVKH